MRAGLRPSACPDEFRERASRTIAQGDRSESIEPIGLGLIGSVEFSGWRALEQQEAALGDVLVPAEADEDREQAGPFCGRAHVPAHPVGLVVDLQMPGPVG